MSHSRVNGLTLRQRMWQVIKDRPHMRVADIAREMGIGPGSASDAVCWLERAGYAKRHGKPGSRVTYTALRFMPPDLRGLVGGSCFATRTPPNKVANKKLHFLDKRVHRTGQKKGKPSLEIEKAWGWGV